MKLNLFLRKIPHCPNRYVTKIFIIISINLFYLTSLKAQSKIGGQIIDEDNKPVELATVLLMSIGDSSVVQATLTNTSGFFLFEKSKYGVYRVVGSCIGYHKNGSTSFEVTTATVRLQPIKLMAETHTIDEVRVSAPKQFLEQQADKLVVNVAISPISAGTTALEVLRQVPGVQVHNDRVSIAGKNSVSIMVDGKPSPYSDMNAVLREIPSNSIDRIEVITNPSAKYDAAGGAVINLILKRDGQRGSNGMLSLMAGVGLYKQAELNRKMQFYPRYNPSVRFNHRSGKWNVFGSYNFFYRSAFEVNLIQRYYDTIRFDQKNYNPAPYGVHSYRAGVDYYLNDRSTVGIMVAGFDRMGDGKFDNYTTQTNILNDHILDQFSTENRQTIRRDNKTINLNYLYRFDSIGHIGGARQVNFDIDIVHYNMASRSDILIKRSNSQQFENQQSVVQPVDFKTFKVDYAHPINQDTKMEAGAKVSLAQIDNNLNFVANGVLDAHNSNRFIYNETINSAYVTFTTKRKKWNGQLGLRTEQTKATGSIGSDLLVNRNYWQLFPSAFFNYRIDSTIAITAQYSQRIDRPGFQLQNPFQIYIDPLTYTKGNPRLLPQLSQSYKVGFNYNSQPFFFISYDQTTNVIFEYAPQQEQRIDDQGKPTLITYTVAQNLAKAQAISAQLNFPIKLGKLINGYSSITVNNQQYSATYLNQFYNQTKWYGIFYANLSSKISPSASLQLTGYYMTPFVIEFLQLRPNSSLDLAFEQKFCKGMAKLTLAVSDVLYRDKTNASVEFNSINFRINQSSDTRTARLTFTYLLGSQLVKSARTRSTGSEIENNRVRFK